MNCLIIEISIKKIKMKKLTVLSFGAGQDSTYILYRIVLEKYFRDKYVFGDFIVVMSDTGNEHKHTYEHVKFIQDFCDKYEIEFYFLTNGEYHPRTWQTLEEQYERNSSIMSMSGSRSCTDNLKIQPVYNFLDHYIAKKYYGYTSIQKPKGKVYIKKFAKDYGKINMLIGIAAGEERRIMKASKRELKSRQRDVFKKYKNLVPLWFRLAIEKVYPLVIEGIARWNIHDYILKETNLPLPFPSNCMFCPYLSKVEILWLFRFFPNDWYKWVGYERNKINKWQGKTKRNLGVKGEKMLGEILKEAIKEFGHMTDEQLQEYKLSHGHCVQSTY